MNPLLQAFLTRMLLVALGGVVAWFVQHGYLTQEEASNYAIALVAAIIAAVGAYYTAHKDQLQFLTGAASPKPVSLDQVNAMIKDGQAPPASLASSRVPYLQGALKVRNDGPDMRADSDK